MRTSVSCGQGGGIPPGCMIVIQPGWGVSIKLYDTTQEYSQEYSIMLYRRDLDRSMSAVTGSCADYCSCTLTLSYLDMIASHGLVHMVKTISTCGLNHRTPGENNIRAHHFSNNQ